MKLSKESLSNLIQEELEELTEIDLKGWLQKLKAIKASDFLKDLRGTTQKDFTGVQRPELQRIAAIYKLLVQYAKDDNLQSGPIDIAIDKLEAALNKAGTMDKVVGGQGEEENSRALPADIQADIVATLTGLKSGKIDSTTGRNALVKVLSGLNLFEALSRNSVFTTINFLNDKMFLSLNEKLSLFVKQNMKSEILTEIKNVKEVMLLSEKLEKEEAAEIRSLIGKLNDANPAQIVGITNSIFKILKTKGMITPDSNQEREFVSSRPKRQKAPATNVIDRDPPKADDEPMDLGLEPDDKPEGETYSQRAAIGRNTPERAKRRRGEEDEEKRARADQDRGYKITNESLYRHLHNLSEQNIIHLDYSQKRIVKTMMIAEAQLSIYKYLEGNNEQNRS